MDDPTWNIAPNWLAQRALIELLHSKGIVNGRPLSDLLDRHADPGEPAGPYPMVPTEQPMAKELDDGLDY